MTPASSRALSLYDAVRERLGGTSAGPGDGRRLLRRRRVFRGFHLMLALGAVRSAIADCLRAGGGGLFSREARGLRLGLCGGSSRAVRAVPLNNLTRLADRLRGGGPRRFWGRHSRARLGGSYRRVLARTFALFFGFWTHVSCQTAHAAERRVLAPYIAQRYRCRKLGRANPRLCPGIEIIVRIKRKSASLAVDGSAAEYGQLCERFRLTGLVPFVSNISGRLVTAPVLRGSSHDLFSKRCNSQPNEGTVCYFGGLRREVIEGAFQTCAYFLGSFVSLWKWPRPEHRSFRCGAAYWAEMSTEGRAPSARKATAPSSGSCRCLSTQNLASREPERIA